MSYSISAITKFLSKCGEDGEKVSICMCDLNAFRKMLLTSQAFHTTPEKQAVSRSAEGEYVTFILAQNL